MQQTVSLSTADIFACASDNRTELRINLTSFSLRFDHKAQNTEGAQNIEGADGTTCVIHIIHPSPVRMFSDTKPHFDVRLSYQTCTERNFVSLSPDRRVNMFFFKPDYEYDRVVWSGCEPDFDPLPGVFTYVKELWVSLHLQDVSVDYSVWLSLNSSTRPVLCGTFGFPMSNKTELEVVYLSDIRGKCQWSLRQTCARVCFSFIASGVIDHEYICLSQQVW